VTDLERFFDRLVRNLAASDPGRLGRPIPVVEIKTTILPYRSSRRSLGLESSEEYEELLVRLVGQEGDLVRTIPPEVADWCRRQMSSLTPDLSGIPGQASATVEVNPDALAKVLGGDTAAGLAKALRDGKPAGPLAVPEVCPHCSTALPEKRAVNFCPSCGRSVTAVPCNQCGADLEPGWRFCISCGQEVTDTATPTG